MINPVDDPERSGMSDEEIAEELSQEEGRPVTVEQVRLIERTSLMKIRNKLARMGLTAHDLLPE